MGCLYHQHEILQCSFILLGGERTVRVKCLTQENSTMSPGQDLKAGPLVVVALGKDSFSFRKRIQSYCLMDLRNFPMDEQTCELSIQSCKYSTYPELNRS